MKDLGVYFDPKLTFITDINTMSIKFSFSVFESERISKLCDNEFTSPFV